MQAVDLESDGLPPPGATEAGKDGRTGAAKRSRGLVDRVPLCGEDRRQYSLVREGQAAGAGRGQQGGQ